MKVCEACGEPAYSGKRLCHSCASGAQSDFVFDSEAPTSEVVSPNGAHEFAWDDGPLPVLAPASTGSGNVCVLMEPRYEYGSAPADADPVVNVLLTLSASGEPLRADRSGPMAHVILALDLSASMNHPDKYPVLTEALEGMLYALQSGQAGEVLLSVVAFAKGSEIMFRAVPARSLTARDLIDALDRSPLRFGRYTDIVGALHKAGRIALDSHKADGTLPVRIYLLTDGKPQDEEGATVLMQRIAKTPVDVDALAFGADADVQMLQRLICGNRGGTVKHVRTETLNEAYGRIAEVVQKVVAKRALLNIELASAVVGGALYRFRPGRHAYGRDAFAGGRSFRTDLGTLEDERSYSLLFEVRLPHVKSTDSEIGRVTLKVPGYGGPQVFETTLAIPRHRGTVTLEPDPLVVEARHVLVAMDDQDVQSMLKALRARRKLYVAEHRDPYLLEVLDKAISELTEAGTLDALSSSERASLTAHTATAGSRPFGE